MRRNFYFLIILGAASLFVGCMATRKAFETPPPVVNQAGIEEPQNSPAVDALITAREINKQLNVTPVSGAIDLVLGSLILVTGAVGGFLARHKTAKSEVQLARLAPPPDPKE